MKTRKVKQFRYKSFEDCKVEYRDCCFVTIDKKMYKLNFLWIPENKHELKVFTDENGKEYVEKNNEKYYLIF